MMYSNPSKNKRLATAEEKEMFRNFLRYKGCPLEYIEKIVADRPFISEVNGAIIFLCGKRKKKKRGRGFGVSAQ